MFSMLVPYNFYWLLNDKSDLLQDKVNFTYACNQCNLSSN